jgi:hypothetical protein
MDQSELSPYQSISIWTNLVHTSPYDRTSHYWLDEHDVFRRSSRNDITTAIAFRTGTKHPAMTLVDTTRQQLGNTWDYVMCSTICTCS